MIFERDSALRMTIVEGKGFYEEENREEFRLCPIEVLYISDMAKNYLLEYWLKERERNKKERKDELETEGLGNVSTKTYKIGQVYRREEAL
jgi:hypothetical protein